LVISSLCVILTSDNVSTQADGGVGDDACQSRE
jgi:hypothetical protein